MARLKWLKKTPLEGFFKILEYPLKQQNENSCLAYTVLRVNTATARLRASIFHAILHTPIPLRYKSPTQSSLSLSLSVSLSLSRAVHRFEYAVSVLTGLCQLR